MPVHKKEIASILNKTADLLDLKGENEFRVRSYRTAAQSISGYSESINKLIRDEQKLSSLEGVGSSMSAKIREIAETGRLQQFEDLKDEIPVTLLEIMKMEQMGPERTRQLYRELSIESLNDLEKHLKDGKVKQLEGFGEKTVEKIRKELNEMEGNAEEDRFRLDEAEDFATSLLDYLKDKGLKNVTVAGSFRRRKETIGDLDILATADEPEEAMDYFVDYDERDELMEKGDSRSRIRLRSGLQIDLRIVERKSFGAALLYFTGSKEHSVELRKRSRKKNYKMNEYGIFEDGNYLAGEKEEDMYKKLNLAFIPPELRERRGELEAASDNSLPELVSLKEIKGDLQTHTSESDGKNTLKEMVNAAADKGYEYYAVTDHSKRVSMANGLNEERLEKQIEAIDTLNSRMKKIRVLKSIEVDILEDGRLDLPDEVLKKLDLVVCAIHYGMNLSSKKQTERILRAMDNPYFNILAHPTGRRINERKGMEMDLERIMKEAAERGIFLEINANPERLDLNDANIRLAKDLGVKMAISTDAHSTGNLNNMKYGVEQARRGWIEKEDIINTLPWKSLKSLLKRN